MATGNKGDVRLNTFNIEWKIERFFADCKQIGDCHRSPDFPINYPGKDCIWNLLIYPMGCNKEYENCVGLYLGFRTDSGSQVTVDYQCTIVSKQNYPSRKIKRKTFKGSSNGHGWPMFVRQDEVKDIKNGALINDTIKILFEIKFHPVDQDVAEDLYDDYINKIASGLEDYEELLESGNFADVTFNVQKHEIHLHKAILSCRSSVFRAMFENDMTENKQSTVNIEDIDFAVMMELFRFIYAGKVENIEDVAVDLLVAADKYDVVQLKALCEKSLIDNVTTDNVVESLQLGCVCDTLHLKKLLIKFIVDNLKDVVGMSDFFTVFAELNPKVLCEIIKAIAEKK